MFDLVVVMVVCIIVGTIFNVIFEYVDIFGIIRVVLECICSKVYDVICRVVEGVVVVYDVLVWVEVELGYLVIVNDYGYVG